FDSAAQGTEQGKVIVTQVEAEMSGFSSNDIASGTLTTSLENGQIFSPWAYVAGAAAVLGGIALAAGGGEFRERISQCNLRFKSEISKAD
ncbi:hypothetical protein P9091_12335, partial [Gallibacterium anatis]